jgi:hypothetical protein
VGERVRKYDRAAWLQDRARMFQLLSSDGTPLMRPTDGFASVEEVPLTELDCQC